MDFASWFGLILIGIGAYGLAVLSLTYPKSGVDSEVDIESDAEEGN